MLIQCHVRCVYNYTLYKCSKSRRLTALSSLLTRNTTQNVITTVTDKVK